MTDLSKRGTRVVCGCGCIVCEAAGLVVDDDDEEVGGWLLSEGYGSFATCKD